MRNRPLTAGFFTSGFTLLVWLLAEAVTQYGCQQACSLEQTELISEVLLFGLVFPVVGLVAAVLGFVWRLVYWAGAGAAVHVLMAVGMVFKPIAWMHDGPSTYAELFDLATLQTVGIFLGFAWGYAVLVWLVLRFIGFFEKQVPGGVERSGS